MSKRAVEIIKQKLSLEERKVLIETMNRWHNDNFVSLKIDVSIDHISIRELFEGKIWYALHDKIIDRFSTEELNTIITWKI